MHCERLSVKEDSVRERKRERIIQREREGRKESKEVGKEDERR